MATAAAQSNLPAPAAPQPESNTGAVTRSANEIEDPYIWKPAGAFGLQHVQAQTQAKTQAPVRPAPKPSTPGMAEANEAYEALWRWRDFAAGLAVGILSIVTLNLFYKVERR